jgi:hypothetical protein
MPGPLRKLTIAAVAALAAVALGACGEAHTRVTTGTYAGESGKNAPYLNVGPLVYQVQISRQLNPANPEDAAYLQGLTPAEAALGAGEEWFAVFLQVYNETHNAEQASGDITISDTQGNVYTALQPATNNAYVYRGGTTVRSNGKLPEPGTVPYFAPAQGELLLYKIKVVSLDNRPIEIKIRNPRNPVETANAELDV